MTFNKPKSPGPGPSTRPPPPVVSTTNRPPVNVKDALTEARAISGAVSTRPSASPASMRPVGKKTIVIVDDDAAMRARLRAGLEAFYEVIEAKDGMEAAELAGKMPAPAMFVCDVVMPRVDGFTLAKILKANPIMKRVPIMFVSSRNSPQDVTQALVLGACQYVLKSVPIGEIVAKIRKIVLRGTVQFRLGNIPVRIRGAFFFLLLVLGAQWQVPQKIAVFTAVAFVSVMVHELGHALVGRMFGLLPVIELNGMGGLTSWQNPREVGHWRSIAISIAGPLAGFLIGAALLLAGRLGFHPRNALAVFAFEQALFVNFVWGVLNLAPMLPLDGGNILRSALNILTKGEGEKPARVVSILVGVGFVITAFVFRQWWAGALAAFFTFANVQGYRHTDTRNADAPLAEAIEKAYVALEKDDGAEAIALLRPAIVPQASEALRGIALRIYCYALLIEGEWEELLPTLQKNVSLIGPDEMSRYATTARELGRATEAERITKLIAQLSPVQARPANDFG